jgi:multiple sugar transport system substrate-binding protein
LERSLDEYIENPALTSPDYDLNDFYPRRSGVNRVEGQALGHTGQRGGLLALLPHGHTQEAGLEAPQTWDELIAAVKEVDGKTFAGKRVDGFVARGDKTFPTIQSGYSTAFLGYGATDVDDSARWPSTAPRASRHREVGRGDELRAQQRRHLYLVRGDEPLLGGQRGVLYRRGPHVRELREPRGQRDRRQGQLRPAAEGDAGRMGNIWLWSLGMSAASKNNVAAWLFLQWATTKEQLEKAIPKGNINPTRQSLANSQTMKEYTKDWGDYNETWQKILSDHAAWNYIKSPKYPEYGTGGRWPSRRLRWARALPRRPSTRRPRTCRASSIPPRLARDIGNAR